MPTSVKNMSCASEIRIAWNACDDGAGTPCRILDTAKRQAVRARARNCLKREQFMGCSQLKEGKDDKASTGRCGRSELDLWRSSSSGRTRHRYVDDNRDLKPEWRSTYLKNDRTDDRAGPTASLPKDAAVRSLREIRGPDREARHAALTVPAWTNIRCSVFSTTDEVVSSQLRETAISGFSKIDRPADSD